MELKIGDLVNGKYYVEKEDSINKNGEKVYIFRCNKCGYVYIKTYNQLIKIINSIGLTCRHNFRTVSANVGRIIGNKYRIIRESGINKYNERLYDFECLDCGFIYRNARIPDINRKVKNNKNKCTHMKQHSVYRRWKVKRIGAIYKNMIYRCYDIHAINYINYGAKGITICEEWLNDHTAFENWMLENGYQDTWEIDRIDHTKGYCPENCRLVPPGYNSKFNKSNCVNYIIDGELVTGPDIARRLGLRNRQYFSIIYNKHGKEYTQKIMEGMLNGTIPLPDKDYHIELYGKEYNVAELARLLELEYMPLYHKMRVWPEKKFNFYIKQRYKEIQFNKEKQEYLNRKVKSCIDSD